MSTVLSGRITLADNEIAMVEGLAIRGPEEQWKQTVTEWAEGVLRRSNTAGVDVEADDYSLYTITMPCEEVVRFRTLNDVPRVTVPCPCGEPDRYLIRYSEVK